MAVRGLSWSNLEAAAHKPTVRGAPRLSVFVVDDNPGLRRSLQALLEAAGLSVETYASAQEFLER